MNEEHVTVDNALIITDIDKLIKILTTHKRVSVSQLQKSTGMDRAAIEKWIEAFEDEGYVRVEHKITDKDVIWLDNAEMVVPSEEHKASTKPGEKEIELKERKMTDSSSDSLDLSLLEAEDEETKEIEPVESIHNSLDNLEQDSAKARVSHIMKKLDEEETTKADQMSVDIDEAKTDLLEGDEKVEEPEQKTSNEDFGAGMRKASFINDNSNYDVQKEDEEEEKAIVKKKQEGSFLASMKQKVSQAVYKEESKKSKVRQVITKYMNDINRQKSEIEHLKREKERIYRDQYLALESKAEADIAAFTEKILEKEGRVLELKERILELPVKLEEVEKMRKSLIQIEQEGRKVLTNVSARVNNFIDEVKKSEIVVYKKLDEGRSIITKANQKLGELRELGIVADRRIEDLKMRTTEIELQIDELNKAMRDMLAELEEATEMKVEITEIEHRISGAVDKKEDEMEALLNDLEEIKKLEEWVSEYLADYEKKIDEIESYTGSSEAELDKLRELAEVDHLKKYLKGLDQLTKEYQNEMSGIVDEQQSVDSKIEEAKTHLSNLIAESQNLIRKLQQETSSIEEFDEAAGKAKQRLEGIRKTVEEKAKERDKLKEDVSKVKKKRRNKKEQRKKEREK